LLKTSSFMPFFNGDASVIMGALKTNRHIRFPGNDRQPELNTHSSERVRSTDTAPVRARPDRDAAGGTCRSDCGPPD
jgi:hypothetical protein